MCAPEAWKDIRSYAKSMKDLNATLRGALPELLASLFIMHQGCREIKTSFKPRALGGQEIDVLGIKHTTEGDECVIIETKGQSTTDKELQNEIGKFASKVHSVQEKWPEIAKEIGYNRNIVKFSGIFISMATVDGLKLGDYDVEFWDYRRFVHELKRARFDRRYIDLLEQTTIAFDISLEELAQLLWGRRGESE